MGDTSPSHLLALYISEFIKYTLTNKVALSSTATFLQISTSKHTIWFSQLEGKFPSKNSPNSTHGADHARSMGTEIFLCNGCTWCPITYVRNLHMLILHIYKKDDAYNI